MEYAGYTHFPGEGQGSSICGLVLTVTSLALLSLCYYQGSQNKGACHRVRLSTLGADEVYLGAYPAGPPLTIFFFLHVQKKT